MNKKRILEWRLCITPHVIRKVLNLQMEVGVSRASIAPGAQPILQGGLPTPSI